MYIVSLSWSSECYHTHWTKKFKSEKKALELYHKTLRDQAIGVTKEQYDKDITMNGGKSFKDAWDDYTYTNGDLELFTEEEIKSGKKDDYLEKYIDYTLDFMRQYFDSDEKFNIELD